MLYIEPYTPVCGSESHTTRGHTRIERANYTEVWRAVLGELQLQLPRPTFETWLKQTEGISCDGRSFVVEVPTPFAVAWLERRMYQSIQKTVEKITQQPLDIQFQVRNGASNQAGAVAVASRVPGTPQVDNELNS